MRLNSEHTNVVFYPFTVSEAGVADHGAQCDAISRPGGFPLLHQVAQRLFSDHRKHHIAHHAVGLGERGVGKFEQQVLLSGDTLEVVQQLSLNLALGTRVDLMDGFDLSISRSTRSSVRLRARR